MTYLAGGHVRYDAGRLVREMLALPNTAVLSADDAVYTGYDSVFRDDVPGFAFKVGAFAIVTIELSAAPGMDDIAVVAILGGEHSVVFRAGEADEAALAAAAHAEAGQWRFLAVEGDVGGRFEPKELRRKIHFPLRSDPTDPSAPALGDFAPPSMREEIGSGDGFSPATGAPDGDFGVYAKKFFQADVAFAGTIGLGMIAWRPDTRRKISVLRDESRDDGAGYPAGPASDAYSMVLDRWGSLFPRFEISGCFDGIGFSFEGTSGGRLSITHVPGAMDEMTGRERDILVVSLMFEASSVGRWGGSIWADMRDEFPAGRPEGIVGELSRIAASFEMAAESMLDSPFVIEHGPSRTACDDPECPETSGGRHWHMSSDTTWCSLMPSRPPEYLWKALVDLGVPKPVELAALVSRSELPEGYEQVSVDPHYSWKETLDSFEYDGETLSYRQLESTLDEPEGEVLASSAHMAIRNAPPAAWLGLAGIGCDYDAQYDDDVSSPFPLSARWTVAERVMDGGMPVLDVAELPEVAVEGSASNYEAHERMERVVLQNVRGLLRVGGKLPVQMSWHEAECWKRDGVPSIGAARVSMLRGIGGRR